MDIDVVPDVSSEDAVYLPVDVFLRICEHFEVEPTEYDLELVLAGEELQSRYASPAIAATWEEIRTTFLHLNPLPLTEMALELLKMQALLASAMNLSAPVKQAVRLYFMSFNNGRKKIWLAKYDRVKSDRRKKSSK